MTVIRTYRDLAVWRLGMDMVVDCYRLTRAFPKEERFGLSSQLQRSAVSVPSNVAEGNGRLSTPEYLLFLRVAHGSLCELETHLMIANRLDYMAAPALTRHLKDTERCGVMLRSLMNKLEQRRERA